MGLDLEETSEHESDGLLGLSKTYSHKKYGKLRITQCLIMISLSLNIFVIGLGLIHWFNRQTVRRSYELGFDSDLGSIKSEIELIQYHFTGGVELDEDGKFFTEHQSHSGEQYVGIPTPEIDHAWAKLLTGLNIDLEGSDAHSLQETTFQWPDSGYFFTGLEVFHSLHCLNRLRQALYPDYYDVISNPDDPSRETHIGHCINHLRQAIQCHADLTPMEWTQTGNKVILKTDTLHTCRNFDKIHDWARKRRTHFEDIEGVENGSLLIVD